MFVYDKASLFEQDLAYRFSFSQSTVNQIYMYIDKLSLLELPLWPPTELVKANIPQRFKTTYSNT